MFSAPKLSRELNKLLQWETYNPISKLNKNGLTIIKIAFYMLRFTWSDLVEKHVKANN